MKGVYNIFKASVMPNHQVNAIWMVQVRNSWIKNKAEGKLECRFLHARRKRQLLWGWFAFL